MKTPDEIKKAMRGCHSFGSCSECPYFSLQVTIGCKRQRNADALALIQQLEAERDAAVADVYRSCFTCKKFGKSEYLNTVCNECIGWRNWQWRGVQKEDGND